MSHEIVREQEMMLLLSSMRSEEKVADFLLDLSQRFNSRGLSPLALELPMTRHEIGAYLGMSLETVSQCLSKLHADRVVDVCQQSLLIVDEKSLSTLVPSMQR